MFFIYYFFMVKPLKISLLSTYWVVPRNLEPEKFAVPRWKTLSKKGRKINQKIYKQKQGG